MNPIQIADIVGAARGLLRSNNIDLDYCSMRAVTEEVRSIVSFRGTAPRRKAKRTVHTSERNLKK